MQFWRRWGCVVQIWHDPVQIGRELTQFLHNFWREAGQGFVVPFPSLSEARFRGGPGTATALGIRHGTMQVPATISRSRREKVDSGISASIRAGLDAATHLDGSALMPVSDSCAPRPEQPA